MELRVCSIIQVRDEVGTQTIIDQMFSSELSQRFIETHPIGKHADKVIARDPGDSLVYLSNEIYMFWDASSEESSVLGSKESDFVIGYEE